MFGSGGYGWVRLCGYFLGNLVLLSFGLDTLYKSLWLSISSQSIFNEGNSAENQVGLI